MTGGQGNLGLIEVPAQIIAVQETAALRIPETQQEVGILTRTAQTMTMSPMLSHVKFLHFQVHI